MDIAAFVFAGGILLMGIAAVVIFRDNRNRAAQVVGRDRDRAARRGRGAAGDETSAARRKTALAGIVRCAFVEPEIRDCGVITPREREAERDRPAA